MRKWTVLFMLVLLAVFGRTVQAADARADEILNEAERAMKQVKVICNGVLVNGELLTEVKADTNTGVIYMNMLGSEIWIDKQSKMSYISDGKDYYFMPLDDAEIADTYENMDFSADINRTLAFTFEGEITYKVNNENVACYKLSADYVEQGYGVHYDYYIDKVSYRLAAVEESMAEVKSVAYYYYPESVTVSQEIQSKAVIAMDYSFDKNKVEYIVKYEKKKPVLYVIAAKKAKGSVKIPDTIRLCGKKYEVYGIAPEAFKNNKKIKAVTIGKNVRKIGKKAFYNCKKLEKVTIQSKKITKIESKAFYKNAKTLRFKLPKSKMSKYKKLIQKSGISSKLVISK